MKSIVSRIRVYSGTFYAYIPPEIAAKYGLTEGQPIALELSAITTEPLTPSDEDSSTTE